MDSQKRFLETNVFSEDCFSQKYLLGMPSPSSEEDLSQTTLPPSELRLSQDTFFGTYEDITPPGLEDEQNLINAIFKDDVMLSGLNYDLQMTQSQPLDGQLYANVDKVGNTLDVQNNSFNLSDMENSMNELSQGEEDDNVGSCTQIQSVPCAKGFHRFVRPPTEIETPSSSPDFVQNLNGKRFISSFNTVKSETYEIRDEERWSLQENHPSSNCIDTRDENTKNEGALSLCSSENSSQESQGERLPSFEKFGGKYNFWVELGEKAELRKSVFRDEVNKIYCLPDNPILFNFHMDFAAVPLKQLSIQAVLYYTSNSVTMKNVEQCDFCNQVESKGTPITDRNGKDIRGHVIRCLSQMSVYEKKRRLFNSVTVGLEKPQPGTDLISRNYKFMCMNSCRGKQGKQFKLWTLVFYLMKDSKEVGRDVFHLKVCKCPSRDAINDRTVSSRRSKEGPYKPEMSQARKVQSPVKLENLDQSFNHSSPKQRRLSKEPIGAQAQSRERGEEYDSSNPRPGPSRLARAPTSGARARTSTFGAGAGARASTSVLRLANKKNFGNETDSESFSQEDSQCRTFVSKLLDSIKLAVAHRRHPNPVYSQFSGGWVKQLINLQHYMEYYKKHIFKEEDEYENDENPNDA